MNSKIAHLASDEIDELIGRYYSGEPVAALLRAFNISAQPSRLVSLFPRKIHEDRFCPFCWGINLTSERRSRDSRSDALPTCPQCGHGDHASCRCKHCTAAREEKHRELEDGKRRAVIEVFGYVEADPTIEELSLCDAVYLLSVARHSVSEDFYFVSPFSERTPHLAPTFDYRKSIVEHLYAQSLVAVSPESNLDAFAFDEHQNATGYYPTKVHWELLPGLEGDEKREALERLEEVVKQGPWPEHWRSDFRKVWCEIAKHECFEYYEHLLSQRGYDSVVLGPKTHSVFEGLLKSFSVSQIFNLTWQTVRDVTDYIVRERLPKAHAKNVFIGSLQRKADRALAEGWDVRRNRRDYACPQTVISSVFFDVFAGIGHQGFDRILSSEPETQRLEYEASECQD